MAEETIDEKFGADSAGVYKRWMDEIAASEKEFRGWQTRSKKILKRYRDERPSGQTSRVPRINILWSNMETLKPAVFNNEPQIAVTRRHKDADPVGRAASMIVERAVSFLVDDEGYMGQLECVRDDFLLLGRGVPWVRYDPTIEEFRDLQPVTPTEIEREDGTIEQVLVNDSGEEVDRADTIEEDGQLFIEGETFEEVTAETVALDYVHWQDFYHKPLRTWDEVQKHGWVARKTRMSRDELRDRFGDVGGKVPLDIKAKEISTETRDGIEDTTVDRALVWEIWDATSREAIWIAPSFEQGPLDVVEDPLSLRKFFPCPKPAYGTLTNDCLIPIPDFVQYQDQADELDELTARIDLLVGAVKVAGVYDKSLEGILSDLVNDRRDNILIPVERWAALQSKGGMSRVIEYMPLEEIVKALIQLYDARDRTKAELFEVSGFSDLIRGQSKASATATAERIKGEFASLRIDAKRKEMARMIRDTLRIVAEIAVEQFDDETLLAMSDYEFVPGADPAIFQQALELLRSDQARSFRIDIETDDTMFVDEATEKQNRIEFLGAASQFLENSIAVSRQQPLLTPLLGEMMLFGLRGFKTGRRLETVFEQTMASLQDATLQPSTEQLANQPNPQKLAIEEQRNQIKAAEVEGKLANEQERNQVEMLRVVTGEGGE